MKSGGDNEIAANKRKIAEKRLQKLEDEKPVDPSKVNQLQLEKKETRRTGNYVLEVKDFNFGIDGNRFLTNFNFSLWPGEKICLDAENGRGKTSFLRVIWYKYLQNLQEEFPGSYEIKRLAKKYEKSVEVFDFNGLVKLSSTVRMEYFEQSNELNIDTLLKDYIWEVSGKMSDQAKFGIVKKYNFTKEDLGKTVKDLSGGQKSKLKLLKLMHTDANFLVLDEPTNHLDLKSIEELEKFVKKFEGVVLFVSHDKDFQNIADNIVQFGK